MAPRESRKLQRWIDLVASLLASTQGVTRSELRSAVPGYTEGRAESMRRTFERDKDELRAVGVLIETLPHLDSAETRYRLRPESFYLPYLGVMTARGLTRPKRVDRHGYRALQEWQLNEDDLSLLADAAARVAECGDPTLTADAQNALRKLAIDVPAEHLTTTKSLQVFPTSPRPSSEVLGKLSDALHRRKQVTLTYYGIERDETERRVVLPYGLSYTSGHWYLHAMDPARGAVRQFRLNRTRQVTVNPAAPTQQDYEIPADFDLASRARVRPPWTLGEDEPVAITVKFLRDNGAVRAARALGGADHATPEQVVFQVRRREVFFRWLLGLAGDAVPVAPYTVVQEYAALVQRTCRHHRGEGAA